MDGLKLVSWEEKEKLVSQAQSSGASVYFKFPNTTVFKTRALAVGSKKILSCRRPALLALTQTNKPVTMNFVLNSELYFLATSIVVDQKEVYFKLDADIYHLARRKNRRQQIPPGYTANLMIKRLADQMSFLRGLILDISPRGCRIALNTGIPLVNVGDIVEGTLKIGQKTPIEVTAKVNNHAMYVRKEYKQIFGIEYTGLNDHLKTRLESVYLDLQREFFLKALE